MNQGFNMQQPGTSQSRAVPRSYTVKEAPKKRCGLIPIRPETGHKLKIAGKEQIVTAKDRRAFPDATGKFICLHAACAGKFFDNETALQKGHDPQTTLEARGEVHPFGFWSNDPCNVHPEPGCEACKAASAEATRAARSKIKDAAEVLTPCAEHAGGCLGLLTPTDPSIPTA